MWPHLPLRVSASGRSLEDLNGKPFFYLADTAWMCLWKGTLEQWTRYFDLRVSQGYSVIQTVLLPFEWDKPDAEGNLPFDEGDFSRPNEAYFSRAERFCAMAAERGLYVCLFLFWTGPRNTGPSSHFTVEQAQAFARYAAERFGKYPVLWSLSGDGGYHREPEKWEAIGQAVEAADRWAHPTTVHLWTRMDWYFLFHQSRWLDFHMVQTGHSRWAYADVADVPAAYRALEPAKPMVNGEPWYENHPERIGPGQDGPAFTPYEARYAFWVSVLSGATMGHTYGGQGVWNWKLDTDSDRPVGGPGIGPPWHEAMRYDGAAHCGVGATVLRALPWWRLRPAPERVHLDPALDTNFRPFCAVIPNELWVVYVPRGPLAAGQLVLKGLDASDDWRARWVDPRTGQWHDSAPQETGTERWWRAAPPPTEEDWVLVLDRGAPRPH
jgi:hypothetical protein